MGMGISSSAIFNFEGFLASHRIENMIGENVQSAKRFFYEKF